MNGFRIEMTATTCEILAYFLLRLFHEVQVYESCYHSTQALQNICKRTESNQRQVALTHHETKPKDIRSMQGDFQLLV